MGIPFFSTHSHKQYFNKAVLRISHYGVRASFFPFIPWASIELSSLACRSNTFRAVTVAHAGAEGGNVRGRHALPPVEELRPARSSPGEPAGEAGPSMTSNALLEIPRGARARQKSLPTSLQLAPVCARAADRVRLRDGRISRSCSSARKGSTSRLLLWVRPDALSSISASQLAALLIKLMFNRTESEYEMERRIEVTLRYFFNRALLSEPYVVLVIPMNCAACSQALVVLSARFLNDGDECT